MRQYFNKTAQNAYNDYNLFLDKSLLLFYYTFYRITKTWLRTI